MFKDVRGLPLTTESAQAVSHYNTAIDHYFEYRLDTGKCLNKALEADPAFVMGQCMRGYLMMLFGTTSVYGKAREALAICREGAGQATAREALHVDALEAWLAGDLLKANAIWDQIQFEHPTDLVAIRLQHFNLFWMGRSFALRGSVAKVVQAWDESIPGYGNLLGMLAFGLEECGDYAQAETKGRRAVEHDGEDLWAIHAVAHVLEMQGRLAEGVAWLDYPAERWADRNPFRGHLWWHKALFHLEAGDYDAALALYDASIRCEASDFYLDIQNAAALLLRLEFQGMNVGDRWQELADNAETHIEDHALAFTDLHHMISLVREGRFEAAERLLASMAAFSAQPNHYEAATMEPVTIPVAKAILAYGQGGYEAAIDLLLPLRYDFACLGGSHAQRDLFVQLLLECAIKAGQQKLVRALLSERLALKQNSRGNWVKYARVLECLSDSPGSAAARKRADQIGLQ